MKIDFAPYIGKPIVLITNFTNDPERISGIRDENLGIQLFSVQGRYVCARTLTKSDLDDEDFVGWLNAMWPTIDKLLNHIRNAKCHTGIHTGGRSSKRNKSSASKKPPIKKPSESAQH